MFPRVRGPFYSRRVFRFSRRPFMVANMVKRSWSEFSRLTVCYPRVLVPPYFIRRSSPPGPLTPTWFSTQCPSQVWSGKFLECTRHKLVDSEHLLVRSVRIVESLLWLSPEWGKRRGRVGVSVWCPFVWVRKGRTGRRFPSVLVFVAFTLVEIRSVWKFFSLTLQFKTGFLPVLGDDGSRLSN